MITPGIFQAEPFGVLPVPMLAQVANGQTGQHQDPRGGGLLRLDEAQLTVDALQSAADTELPRLQVDILPAQEGTNENQHMAKAEFEVRPAKEDDRIPLTTLGAAVAASGELWDAIEMGLLL